MSDYELNALLKRRSEQARKAYGSAKSAKTRFHATCEFCGRELDTRQRDIHQFVTAWVMEGGPVDAAGRPVIYDEHVVERADRWAHPACIAEAEMAARAARPPTTPTTDRPS
jgi:hypothetical protein